MSLIEGAEMTHEELFGYVTRGNQEADSFLRLITEAFHVWDDLIDKDKDIADEDINKAFFTAFVLLPENKFYMSNIAHLHPVICNAITNWYVANGLERGICTEAGLHISFIIRSEYVNLVIEAARLCGGHDWANYVATQVRMVGHEEGFSSYKESLIAEKHARKEE